MNRTLKRPMFRMGGSSGTGITSGLDRPGYRQGTTVGGQFFPYGEGDRVSQGALDVISAFPNRMNAMKQPTVDQGTKTPTLGMNQNMTPSIKRLSTEERLMEALGKRDKGEDISKFLINFGLNLASATPRGGLLATAAEAAKGPSGDLFDAIDAEKDLERQIKLSAAQTDIAQEGAVELQMLKNLDEDTRSALMKKAQEGVDAGYYEDVNEGIRRLLTKDEFGVQNMPGEQRADDVRRISAQLQGDFKLSPIVADKQAEFYADFTKTEKANPDVNFDINDPFWEPTKTTGYKEGVVYYDYESRRYFRRDSGAEASENTPPGFVEVQIN
tara:strand:- start:1643 stop:2626 length:984 start_codon:yes stop_codon:yes gene_type:complete